MKKFVSFLVCLMLLYACNNAKKKPMKIDSPSSGNELPKTSLVVLGTVQDAGSPHIACKKDCCKSLFSHPDNKRKVVSLGLVDLGEQKKFIFDI